MKSFKSLSRIRKASPDPLKYLRLHRAEFASTFKKKKYDFDNYYPNIEPLIKTISKFYNLRKDMIYVGLGSESIIRDILLLFFLKRKKNCIGSSSPNFFMYKYFSNLFGYEQKEYQISPDKINNITLKFIKEFIKEKKLNFFILVNPSHPFEKYWKNKEVEEISKYCKKQKVTLLIDEVYQGLGSKFSNKLIQKYDNLIIMKSFSKTTGLPGLRVGFALSNKKIINELNTLRLAIELPEYSIRKAISYFKNPKKLIYPKIKSIRLAREYAHKQFKNRNIKSFGHHGSSVTFQIDDKKKINKILIFLKRKKVLVSTQNKKIFKKYINITTTNISNIKYFFNILDKVL